MFVLDNLTQGEHVFQRCILVTGHDSTAEPSDGDVVVTTTNEAGHETFPQQTWPLCGGHAKALVFLSPGHNCLTFTVHTEASSAQAEPFNSISVTYTPLLQNPPLHLAILVAKDSCLQIDCPSAKHGAITSTHASVEAAIAKLRLSAYMWQALTAEDLRAKGLGRLSFRLEEEWSCDTLSSIFSDHWHAGALNTAMHSTAKVHLVRTDRTVSELRDAQRAQQNPNARSKDELHAIFITALKQHGGVFESSAHPIVAGLILDSHYSPQQDLILGHAALGCHNPNGMSLGIFGSHLCYSWPRFVEEIPDCLLDTRCPGDNVGNDNRECSSMWEACAVGQGAFLHEVGHALSAPHTSGIMARGYSKNWPKCFLSCTAYCSTNNTEGITSLPSDAPHDCHWDIRDALRFANLPHFRHPSDHTPIPTAPQIELLDDEDFSRISITSEAGIAQVWLNGALESSPTTLEPLKTMHYTADELESRFDRSKPLELEVLATNGKQRKVDVWRLFSDRSYIRVPGTAIRLQKQSVSSQNSDSDSTAYWTWAVMLKKRGRAGLIRATKLDIRVGCGLDGAVVHYADGTKTPCGPLYDANGHECSMGGHQARKIALPSSVEITKVQVSRRGSSFDLDGLRMHLSNGRAMGALNKQRNIEVVELMPQEGQKIIGFFGKSGTYGMCCEFGIVTASKDTELPEGVYNLPELQNIDGGTGVGRGRKRKGILEEDEEDGEIDTSEDEDTGYDYDTDVTES